MNITTILQQTNTIETNKDLYFQTYKYLNITLINNFLQIFKNIEIKIYGLEITVQFTKKNLINNLLILKKNSSFLYGCLVDIVVEDFPKKKKRFFIKYLLKSVEYSKILQITLKIKEYTAIFSIINLYKNAFWLEREVWDMYGIFFSNNLDLRRILTDYGFRGNPLKKDFPLVGFLEIYFNFFSKKLKFKKVTVLQKSNN